MQETPEEFVTWHAPSPAEIGDDHIDFLHRLQAPTWITVPGRDRSRTRAIVTLLHGNEPSGLKAVHRLLKEEIIPATDLVIFVAAVNTALAHPILSHRFLPWEEDFNRCFNAPARTRQEKLAQRLITALREISPEAIIDTHNTSAHSEPFCVTVRDDAATLRVSGLFSERLVVMDQHLGTLIEQADAGTPIVTVEFGGFMDPRADLLARETLFDFVCREELFDTEPVSQMILHHPLRLEIDHSAEIHYSASVQDDADLTMINTIDQLNFRRVEAGTSIGWLGRTGMEVLNAVNASGQNLIESFFHDVSGFLTTRQHLTIFMATTDPYIARKDCLLYFTPVRQ